MTSNKVINISSVNKYNDCKNKCDLSFKYPISTCIATNKITSIGIKYDNTGNPPVTFNNKKYNVSGSGVYSDLEIFSPSLHLFNGAYLDGELVITHEPENGGQTLYICIPVSSSGVIVPASSMLTDIINAVSKNAPNAWQKTTVNLPNFSLQNVVPNKPFYSFTDTNKNNIVVYGSEYAIGLNSSVVSTLKNLIESSTGKYDTGLFVGNSEIYINSSGPNNIQDDQIYIDCKPVNQSEEEIEVTEGTPKTTYDTGNWISSILNSIIFQCIVVIIVLIIMLYMIKYLAKRVSTS